MDYRQTPRQGVRRPPTNIEGFITRPTYQTMRRPATIEATRPLSQAPQPTPPAQPIRPAVQSMDFVPPSTKAPVFINDGMQKPQRRVLPVATPKERRFTPVDMKLPGAEELLLHAPVINRGWWYRTRTMVFRGTVAVMVLSIGLGGWMFGQGYLKLHKAFSGGASAVSLQKNVNPNLLKGEGDGRVNILLLGNGGDGHEAPDLTDTIMVASIDPVNNKATLVSVPRDLWVNVSGHGNMKINAAYETGKYDFLGKRDSSNANTQAVEAGFATADQVVEKVLGINIHYNLLVNFISFRQAVDTVGGVTVNVPETLYDPTMAWENHWNPVLAQQGVQNFDGKQALLYVRSRETSSDFARSERQRAVMTALKDKVVTAGTLSNPLKISQLLTTFGNNVKSDFSLTDAGRLATLMKKIGDQNITSIGLGDGTNTLVHTGRIGNQSVVLPAAGQNQYGDIHDFIRKALPDGYIIKENAKIRLLNASDVNGWAATKADELKSYGYNVISAGNAPAGTIDATKLIDLTHGGDKYTRNYLEKHFDVKATESLPSTVQAGGADFIIFLGR